MYSHSAERNGRRIIGQDTARKHDGGAIIRLLRPGNSRDGDQQKEK
ncbi:MAG TPA: hypothetical protein VFV95_11840 [Vicinamibacterales bacterium]|nr:hypothetical protein [Vicinamibacterales bacterium]